MNTVQSFAMVILSGLIVCACVNKRSKPGAPLLTDIHNNLIPVNPDNPPDPIQMQIGGKGKIFCTFVDFHSLGGARSERAPV